MSIVLGIRLHHAPKRENTEKIENIKTAIIRGENGESQIKTKLCSVATTNSPIRRNHVDKHGKDYENIFRNAEWEEKNLNVAHEE